MSVEILVGDVREMLRTLPADHFDCVVTSPPYWGLRDYGVEGQIGLERSLGEHLAVMVDVFDEVRRVLKPSGSLWLNYGDCYATTPNGRSAADTKAGRADDRTFRDKPFSTVGPIHPPEPGQPFPEHVGRRGGGNASAGAILDPSYERTPRDGTSANKGSIAAAHGARVVAGGHLKPKDLCMIPNRLAIALQDAGWWVRSEIVWGKPNAMPDSSGRYRPATAHEKVFLLAKSDEVDWWVARDTGEISSAPDLTEQCLAHSGQPVRRWIGLGMYYDAEAVRVGRASNEDVNCFRGGSYVNGTPGPRKVSGNRRVDKQRGHSRRHAGFNDRWDDLPRDEQRANGRFLRNYEPAPASPTVWEIATAAFSDAHFATFPPDLVERCLRGGCPPHGRVLDPFGGAGTTGYVADVMGLDCTLIELNPDYAAMAERRIAALRMGPDERRRTLAAARAGSAPADLGPLFGGGA